jgi:hypothetical protein
MIIWRGCDERDLQKELSVSNTTSQPSLLRSVWFHSVYIKVSVESENFHSLWFRAFHLCKENRAYN